VVLKPEKTLEPGSSSSSVPLLVFMKFRLTNWNSRHLRLGQKGLDEYRKEPQGKQAKGRFFFIQVVNVK